MCTVLWNKKWHTGIHTATDSVLNRLSVWKNFTKNSWTDGSFVLFGLNIIQKHAVKDVSHRRVLLAIWLSFLRIDIFSHINALNKYWSVESIATLRSTVCWVFTVCVPLTLLPHLPAAVSTVLTNQVWNKGVQKKKMLLHNYHLFLTETLRDIFRPLKKRTGRSPLLCTVGKEKKKMTWLYVADPYQFCSRTVCHWIASFPKCVVNTGQNKNQWSLHTLVCNLTPVPGEDRKWIGEERRLGAHLSALLPSGHCLLVPTP